MLGVMSRLKSLKGAGYKTRLLNPRDELWERRLGVRTLAVRPEVGEPESADWQCAYVAIPYSKLGPRLRHIGIGPDDVFVDLGSGLGRSVFMASWMGAKTAVGVEIDPVLTDLALANRAKSNLADRDIRFECISAEDYAFDNVSIVYMYQPFGPGTMSNVVRRIEQSLMRSNRQIRIVYINPMYASVIDGSEYLRRLDEWFYGKHARFNTVFWESKY